MRTIAFVPIKLNSERLPHKNLLPLGGHPLCWHISNTLISVPEIDEVYVFCSDPSVKEYIPSQVKLLLRDKSLDQDHVLGAEIYTSFLKEVFADIYILAHTTSPFIRAETVAHALEKVRDGSHDSAFTAQRIQTFSWYQSRPINYDLTHVPRTQDIEPVFVETSGFYIFRRDLFTEHGRRIGFSPYIQEVDMREAVDIDTQEDYDFACLLAR